MSSALVGASLLIQNRIAIPINQGEESSKVLALIGPAALPAHLSLSSSKPQCSYLKVGSDAKVAICQKLFQFQYEFVHLQNICPNCKMYLSKLQNVFVQIAKCICPNCKMYLPKLLTVFVQIAKCICLNC